MQVLKKKKKSFPAVATQGSYYLSAQQYIWHLSLLLFAVSLHDQH